MRIWSLHPKHLDTKGLVALWREALLAKNVLEGKTRGYRNHSQLIRFKTAPKPLDAINFYLKYVWQEASIRNYKFDKSKFIDINDVEKINLNRGQLMFEQQHLLNKLKLRDNNKYLENYNHKTWEIHPLFNLIEGEIEKWENF